MGAAVPGAPRHDGNGGRAGARLSVKKTDRELEARQAKPVDKMLNGASLLPLPFDRNSRGASNMNSKPWWTAALGHRNGSLTASAALVRRR
jgi:hypothetical protein